MKIPKSWNEITIGQYINLLPSNYKKLNAIQSTIHTLSILTGKSKEEIRQLPKDKAERMVKSLSWMENKPQGQYKKTFKLNGKRYKVDPNANTLLAGQYMDAMEILKRLPDDNETIEKNLHLLLSVVCRPQKRKWFKWVDDEIDLVKTAELLHDNLTLDIAYPIIVFFCLLSNQLTPIINDFSNRKIAKTEQELTQMETDLQNSLDGC